MKYLALLRGINVGGNNIIKMLALREAFESSGFTNITTYIQSGNVIFESNSSNTEAVEDSIEKMLSTKFNYNAHIVLISKTELKRIVDQIPNDWKKRNDIRCYVGFLKKPLTAQEALKEIEINEKVDAIKAGEGVIYMTTVLSGLTKSKFNKLASKKIYQHLTIRNLNTTQKLLALMDTVK